MIQMWTFKTQRHFRYLYSFLQEFNLSSSETTGGMIYDGEFLSQVQPPPGGPEHAILLWLQGAEVSEWDKTYLHTFNGLLPTLADWGPRLPVYRCLVELQAHY